MAQYSDAVKQEFNERFLDMMEQLIPEVDFSRAWVEHGKDGVFLVRFFNGASIIRTPDGNIGLSAGIKPPCLPTA